MKKTKRMLKGGKPKFCKTVKIAVHIRVRADSAELFEASCDTVLCRIHSACDERMNGTDYGVAEARILYIRDVLKAVAKERQ